MNINTEITHKEISGSEFKTSNTYCDYHFISADITVCLDIDGARIEVFLQTGHLYDHGDYSMPSNSLSINTTSDYSEIIFQLDSHSEEEIGDKETVNWINEESKTNYTMSEMLQIRTAFRDIEIKAQEIISAAILEAEQELEADNTFYVKEMFIEEIEVEADVFQKQEYQHPALHRFNSEEDADDYIENNTDCSVINAEEARSFFAQEFQ